MSAPDPHAAVPADFPDILKELNRAILRAQPDDIYEFCADYFKKKITERQAAPAPAPASHAAAAGAGHAHNTPAFYAAIQETYTMPLNDKEDAGHEEDHHEHEPFSDDDDEEEDEMPPPPPPTNAHNRGRRTSVSAESMAPTTDKDYVKVDIPKSAEQRKRIESAIHANFLFKSLDEEQYVDVVNAMAEKRVVPGEEVIKQGGIGDFFYVVETGALDVFVSRNNQPAIKVTDYGPNGSFGELALMYNAPRAATVIATQDSVLWALDRVTFRRILMENTSRKRRMYESFLEEVPLLVSLEPYERHKIADALESVTFSDGDVIIRQGDVGDNFYIVESGEASVTQTDENGVEHFMHSVKKGDYFGELALLTDKPRKATITAKGRLKLATLGKKAFVRLLGPVVDIIKRNAANYETVYQKVELD
ncbi:cyclic nucleotide-binding-like protein [Entophlyctis helioformis]|nr:cyclic nucleotide-binding-like protein [Entophlyctis helioformis]